MRIVLAQLNPLIGDLLGNSTRIKKVCLETVKAEVDLLLTPELSLWGYPPRDLLLNPFLVRQQKTILDDLVDYLGKVAPHLKLFIGLAEPAEDVYFPKFFNSIALVESKGWKVIARKQLLPTYDVFDEKRYFRPAESPGVLDLQIDGKLWHLGITICEDLWVEEKLLNQRISGPDPIEQLIPEKIDLLINLSASPFSHSKETLRRELAIKAVERVGCPIIYLNQVGGNDELIFDGSSFVLNSQTELTSQLPSCQEAISILDTSIKMKKIIQPIINREEQLFNALVLGVQDYVKKCGFTSALIGLSGGIDSALVAIIATAALGAPKVKAVLMPSPWNSSNSVKDALDLAKRLEISTTTIPIESLMKSFNEALKQPLEQIPNGITAENLQSRIRGTLLMAIANHEGQLLLSTGNKSELAVGYCTLYGDMNGGLSVIGDLYKTCVFNICEWLDSPAAKDYRDRLGLAYDHELIGEAIRKKPPSAELRPDQLDSDSLPEYTLLDPILKTLIEDRINPEELLKQGHDPKLLSEIQQLLRKGEFKRRQAPPVLKVSSQAFGSGWRLPIAAT